MQFCTVLGNAENMTTRNELKAPSAFQLATSGWIQGTHSIKCQPVDYSDHPQAMYILRAFYWTYFLKLAELLETIFFSLRCKTNQITMLHVYHHVSTLTIAWLACKYIGGKNMLHLT